ncbi:MAG: phosphoribosylamine--glycine ligase, partial [Clostridia bacterium]|nr:phosphoribosylamine--glycine ligase [Clostridia bacterium]
MKLLIVGGGGREHAIAWKLSQSPRVSRIYAAPGNAGIAELGECVPLAATDFDGLIRFAQEKRIDLVVVAPDDPLALGLVDRLEAVGIPAFGPTAAAARIESSKAFSKSLMRQAGIPTADYQVVTTLSDALAAIDTVDLPVVVKADGLALGKGVIIARTRSEAVAAVTDMMEHDRFGKAGHTIILETCLSGPELTVLAFTDGKTIRPMRSSRDHKRAFDHDLGPNTGGMGAVSPGAELSAMQWKDLQQTVFQPTIDALRAMGCPFKGVIYFGLMLTEDGPRVIEYNARFGDPEAQAVLPLLKTDLLEIFEAVIDERLDQMEIEWSDQASCCVVAASGGYP